MVSRLLCCSLLLEEVLGQEGKEGEGAPPPEEEEAEEGLRPQTKLPKEEGREERLQVDAYNEER